MVRPCPLLWSVLLNGRGHGAGTDIITANMHLAGDRVRGECDMNVVSLNILYNVLIDSMLGTGVEAQWGVGASLC